MRVRVRLRLFKARQPNRAHKKRTKMSSHRTHLSDARTTKRHKFIRLGLSEWEVPRTLHHPSIATWDELLAYARGLDDFCLMGITLVRTAVPLDSANSLWGEDRGLYRKMHPSLTPNLVAKALVTEVLSRLLRLYNTNVERCLLFLSHIAFYSSVYNTGSCPVNKPVSAHVQLVQSCSGSLLDCSTTLINMACFCNLEPGGLFMAFFQLTTRLIETEACRLEEEMKKSHQLRDDFLRFDCQLFTAVGMSADIASRASLRPEGRYVVAFANLFDAWCMMIQCGDKDYFELQFYEFCDSLYALGNRAAFFNKQIRTHAVDRIHSMRPKEALTKYSVKRLDRNDRTDDLNDDISDLWEKISGAYKFFRIAFGPWGRLRRYVRFATIFKRLCIEAATKVYAPEGSGAAVAAASFEEATRDERAPKDAVPESRPF